MKRFLVAVTALALLVGFGVSWYQWKVPPSGDGVHYENFAESLVAGHGFAENDLPASDRDPGYAFFLAGLYRFFGRHFLLVHIVQLVLYALLPLVVYYLAMELFGRRRAARIAAALTACAYPVALYIGLFYTEILFTFLLVAGCAAFARAGKKASLAWFGLSGALFSCALLVRSVLIFFPALLLAALLAAQPRRAALKGYAVFVLVSAVVAVPWMIRNERIFGTFTLSNQAGSTLFFAVQRVKIANADLPKVFVANLLGDYFAEQLPGGYNRQLYEEGNYGQRYEDLRRQGLTPVQIDAEVNTEAKQIIKAHPLRYLLVVPPIEFLKLHTPIFPAESVQGLFSDPAKYTHVPGAVKAGIILAVRAIYFIFLIGALLGLIRFASRRPAYLFVLALLGYLVGVYSLLHGIPRYAVPLLPLYILFFAAEADRVLNMSAHLSNL